MNTQSAHALEKNRARRTLALVKGVALVASLLFPALAAAQPTQIFTGNQSAGISVTNPATSNVVVSNLSSTIAPVSGVSGISYLNNTQPTMALTSGVAGSPVSITTTGLSAEGIDLQSYGYPSGSNMTITSYSVINTSGASAHGIFAKTQGQNGEDGENAAAADDSERGGGGLTGGSASVFAFNSIFTSQADALGVLAWSLGGNGGEGGNSGWGFSASLGGAGGNGNAVSVYGGNTAITTLGNRASGILALSQGGNGGNGGDGGTFNSAEDGAIGGTGGDVYMNGNWNITTFGNDAFGIWGKSLGGVAGTGGDGGWTGTDSGDGGTGSPGGKIDLTNRGTILTLGSDSYGMYAESIGGFGGNGGDGGSIFYASGGSGSSAGSGGDVQAYNAGAIITQGPRAHAIFAQSVGGGGGSGGSAGALVGVGGGGSSGGTGGDASATNDGAISTIGAGARGIYVQSVGGGGGDGGDSGGAISVGGSGSATSPGGTATATNNGNISTRSNAVFAQSIGGGGGNGGSSVGWFSFGGSGGGGGNADDVLVKSHGNLTTMETNASAIFAQSVGGGGGNGGSSTAGGLNIAVALGGSGGTGGIGKAVAVGVPADRITGRITTLSANSNGILAQSIGGGGGNGGFATATSVGSGYSAAMAFGGSGGAGSEGGLVNVNFGASGSEIITIGENSNGIFAQSVGGGGGSGGMSFAGAASNGYSAALSMGGSGGSGAHGNQVHVNTLGKIQTKGEHSYGILAQSVGGGGGNGGASVAGTASINAGLALSFGGTGAGGGNGNLVTVATGFGTQIVTEAGNSHGIFAQSVGGGGGSGGASVAGGVSAIAAVNLSFGGSGGGGGTGGSVDVSTLDSDIETQGKRSYGIIAQSVGGGGGDGGSSVAGSISAFAGASFSMGGKGGAGSNGGAVDVDSTGTFVTTTGELSHGIFAQSLGGGGGSGGFSVAGSITNGPSVTLSLGGTGGGGGNGNTVNLHNTAGKVSTTGAGADGVFAQSIGGGGGNGGFSVAGNINTGSLGAGVSASLGGNAGTGGTAGLVSVLSSGPITTAGESSNGIFAQSQGGGGGRGGFSVAAGITTAGGAQLSLGGAGGGGGTGGLVQVNSSSNITTTKDKSNGIVAQSAGGGGGFGGFSVTGGLTTGEANIGVSVGGAGGDGNTGGAVKVGLTGQLIQGTITTSGEDSAGIIAQSVGGGGGNGGFSVSGSVAIPTNPNPAASKVLNVSVGGGGGNGAWGGAVDVLSNAAINTTGANSAGINAQSVGGGGGNGGMSTAGSLSMGGPEESVSVSLPVAVGGHGGVGGVGGALNVQNHGAITTVGEKSLGISAQSIGGGGGSGGNSLGVSLGVGANSEGKKVLGNISVGGGGGDGNNGGAVNLTNSGSIDVSGDESPGIEAQSIGGGGGVGGTSRTFTFNATNPKTQVANVVPIPQVATWLTKKLSADPLKAANNYELSLSIGGNGGGASDGGTVNVTNINNITTRGTYSVGILAQSVGGGGGKGGAGMIGTGTPADMISAFSLGSVTKNLSLAVGGSAGSSGDGKAVTLTHNSGAITTTGVQSYGILAQSIGGGGGVASHWVQAVDPATGGKATIGLTGNIGIGGAGGAAGNGSNVTVNLPVSATTSTINTTGNAAAGIFAQSVGGGGGVAGDVDRFLPGIVNIGIGVGIKQSGGGGGNGGVVAVDSHSNISTAGFNAPGILAQSVGGGGGVGSGLNLGGSHETLFGSVGGAGSGGAVTVSHVGNITTTGASSNGIFAQSAGGTDTGANVTVTATGNIRASGSASNGIFAQSYGFVGNGNINVNVVNGIVQGGVDSGGTIAAGVHLTDGLLSTVSNFGGTITSGSGADGWAIYADQIPIHVARNHTVNNFGTITGSVRLNSLSFDVGVNSFVNDGASAVFNSGATVDLGSGNTLTNKNNATISPGGIGKVLTTTLSGNLALSGNSNWNIDFNNNVADKFAVGGSITSPGNSNTFNINSFGAAPVPGDYTIMTSPSGTPGSVLNGTVHTSTGGLRYQVIDGHVDNSVHLRVTAEAEPSNTFYWTGKMDNLWTGQYDWQNFTSNWSYLPTGNSGAFSVPGPNKDVIFSNSTHAGQDTKLGADFTIKSLTIGDSQNVTINSQPGTTQTLTIAGATGTGIDIQSTAGTVNIGANVAFSGGANTITVNNSALAYVSGAISGSNGLNVAGTSGTGYLILTGTNTYTGGTTISPGVVLFAGLYGATGNLGSGAVTNNGALVIARNNAYNISDSISGTGSLYQYGSGTTTLSAANTYTGTTYLADGVLQLNHAGALGNASLHASDVWVSAGAALDLHGFTPTATIPMSLSGAGTSTVGALTNSSAVAATYNGAVTMQSASTIGGVGNITLTGQVGGAYQLTKAGTNTLTLSGANTYSGGTTLAAGTLSLGSASAIGATGSILLNGGTLQYSASNNNDYSNRFDSASTEYRIDTNGRDVVFASPLTAAASFTKIGGGRIDLAAANTYTGGTTVENGGLYIGNGGTTGSITGNVSVLSAGTLGFNRSNAMTFAGTISGAGSVLKSGSGTTTLTGNNTYTGATHLVEGTLSLGSSGAIGTTGPLYVLGGTLQYTASNTTDYSSRIEAYADCRIDTNGQNVTFASPLTAFAGLTKLGGGTLFLTAANIYTGGTTVANQGLYIGNGGTTGSITGDVNILSGGLGFYRSNAMTFAGTITGAGIVSQVGSGTTTLSGNNTYSGGTHLVDGKLSLGSSGAIGTTGPIEFLGGILQYTASNTTDYSSRFDPSGSSNYRIDTNGQNVTFASPLTGISALTKLGSGTLFLTAANTYTGGTTIGNQDVYLGNGGTTGSITGNVNILSGGVLLFKRSNTMTLAGTISGAGIVFQVGSGTTIVTGNNTYSGGTLVSHGQLLVNNTSGSGTGTNSVGINSGATLGGTGSISGQVTVHSGGHIAPGASMESLDVGSLVLNTRSILDFELGAPGSPGVTSDLINVMLNGGLALNGGSFAFTNAGGLAAGTYKLIDYAGTLSGALVNLGIPTGPAGFSYSLFNNASNTSIDLTVAATSLQGDYNSNGKIDAADYVLWRKSPNTYGGTPAGYNTWRANFGQPGGSGAAAIANAAVPEPASAWLFIVGTVVATLKRRRIASHVPLNR